MNRKNCPNAFDKDYVAKVRSFVNDHIAILLLVWFRKLDDADALSYFTGSWPWTYLLEDIECSDTLKSSLHDIKSEEELHEFCLNHGMYKF